jgi:demethylmenaquinone methyltransferase / 2-methoxy-6-polyprenyl-1,4-benzoquinol methylase
MLAEARLRVPPGITLVEGEADSLPFPDATFDALTFTYLLRYVRDPGATLRELARVVRPGGTVAGLEFALPRGIWRPFWELYVRVGLPLGGRAISRDWGRVGGFLGPSIREFYARWPEARLLELWRAAGVADVRSRRLSLGGGIVTWGHRA